jgi:hypothetical protein
VQSQFLRRVVVVFTVSRTVLQLAGLLSDLLVGVTVEFCCR